MVAPKSIVNVASVRHFSPFRYPGGKTWLVPHVSNWVRRLPRKPRIFCEPFAGGAIVGLTVAMDSLADHVVLIERDEGVAAVWETVFGRNNRWLCSEIRGFEVSRENVVRRLASPARSKKELAFQVVLRNRVQRGGILAPGASLMLKGEGGRGVASRWYPETLAGRIETLHAIRDRVTIVCGDAFDKMRRYLSDPEVTWFVDPPYTAGGKSAGSRLYKYTDLDHPHLFAFMASAAGPVMLTYDDAPAVQELARLHQFQVQRVPMKNTHHDVMFELVITGAASSNLQTARRAVARDFVRELRSQSRQCADPSLFPG